jgi:histidine triad (HIT) family protein
MNCQFCQIIEGKKPARIFYEDEYSIVFADILPRAAIHLLICPKAHYERLAELPMELIEKLFESTKIVAAKLNLEDNFRLVLNNGAQAGQIIDHIHFHFMSNQKGVEIRYKD